MKVVMKKTGQVKNVPDGYARNYLIPNGLALPASEEVIQEIQAKQAAEQSKRQKTVQQWDAVLQKIDGRTIVVHRPANAEGKLFGAVRRQEVCSMLANEHISCEPEWIEDIQIKQTGKQKIRIQFPHAKTAQFVLDIQAEK